MRDEHVDARLRVHVEPARDPGREGRIEVRDLDLDVDPRVALTLGLERAYVDLEVALVAPGRRAGRPGSSTARSRARRPCRTRAREAQQHQRAPDHDHRALLLGVGDADDPERHAAQVLPVGPGEPLEVDRLPQREQLVLGHLDVRRLDRAHRARLVHDGVLLGVGDHRVGDVALVLAVEELHRFSASRTASSKLSGWSLRPGRRRVLHEHLGAQAVDERLDQPERHRGDEGDPVGRQTRCEHGDADDRRRAAAHERGGAGHHLTIGEDVGAPELHLVRGVLALARGRRAS